VSLANPCRKRRRKITIHPRPADLALLHEARRWHALMVALLAQSIEDAGPAAHEGDVHAAT
jgi:hypothetical protein